MRSFPHLAVILGCIFPLILGAQGTRTCTPVGSSVVCTESKPSTGVGGALAGVVEGMAQDRAAKEAKTAAAKAAAAAAAESDARSTLFTDRAIMVLRQSRDSLAFSATDRAAKLDSLYWEEGARAIGMLYTINPTASTQAMRESVEPITDKYRRLKRP